MSRAALRVCSATALAAALLAAAAGLAACGKYGPPVRPEPVAAPADPAENLERGEFDDGDGPGSPEEQAP
jgi:hypothetical protein